MFKMNGVKPRVLEKNPDGIGLPSAPFILNNNLPLLPYEVESHSLRVLPVHPIDLTHALNSIPSDKTLMNVLDYSNGIADYLRGSILLAQYAKHYHVQFKLNVSQHAIRACMERPCEPISKPLNKLLISHKYTPLNYQIVPLIQMFLQSSETTLYMYNNLFYDRELLTSDIKQYINSFFTFKSHYYKDVQRLFPLKHYQVLHIRCKDSEFTTSFTDNNLLAEIIKLQLPPTTMVMSNNYHLKHKLHKLFGFYYFDEHVSHIAHTEDSNDLYSTILEYIVLSKSQRTYCFSYYGHGSGFSEQCSILNDVPYSVVFLPVVNRLNKENVNLLLNFYDTLNDFPKYILNPSSHTIPIRFIAVVQDTACILNSIQSLCNLNLPPMHVYCIGEDVYTTLQKYVSCELVKSTNVAYTRLEILHQNLLVHDYVCITSPNIVYENSRVFDYLLDAIEDNDLLLPSESISTASVSTEWMFLRSTPVTRSLFHPDNYKKKDSWNDSVYIHEIKYKLTWKKLPLSLFPTFAYYQEYKPVSPYWIQFDSLSEDTMVRHHKWYTLHKVNVGQVYVKSFMHYIEGALRLLSLHLQNHVHYCHTDTLPYSTELSAFLNASIQPLLPPTRFVPTHQRAHEKRPFPEILEDPNVDSTLYYYDGIHKNHVYSYLPNMEVDSQFELCIPTLRNAFLPCLPPPSYEKGPLHVVCHIKSYNESTFQVIQKLQKCNQYRILLYTTLDVDMLSNERTLIQDTTNELQMLSDSIHADIIIMTYTSLMISAHLLGSSTQHVICPYPDSMFSHRLLSKCVYAKDVL